jgi:hypothetical protein
VVGAQPDDGAGCGGWPTRVRAGRNPAAPDNPFGAERIMADWLEQSLDSDRDMRDMMYELTFYSLWGTPWARWFGKTHEAGRTLKDQSELRGLPAVQTALMHIGQGGFVEAVIRMLILLAESRGDGAPRPAGTLERVLTQDEPFCNLDAPQRARIIHEQTIIAISNRSGDRDAARSAGNARGTSLAGEVVRYIVGPIEEMDPHTFDMLQAFTRCSICHP